jgi:type IV secretion system protein VirD4
VIKIKKKTIFIIMMISFFISLVVATQMFAKYTNYHTSLGGFTIGDIHVYHPLQFFEFISKFKKSAPLANAISTKIFFIINFTAFFIIFMITRKNIKNISHGSASFAEKNDIDSMDLFPKKEEIIKAYEKAGFYSLYKEKIKTKEEFETDGVVIGRDQFGRDLMDIQTHPVTIVAPTRSGKGVSLVIPTLLTWKGSVIINDIKGENWALTSVYRTSIGQKCLKFAPTDLDSCHFNPLVEIRKASLFEYQDARNIADIIISPDPDKDDFFSKNAVNLLTAVILHVLYVIEDRVATLVDVNDFMTNPSNSLEEKLELMKTTPHNQKYEENLFENIYGKVIEIDGDLQPRVHPSISEIGSHLLNSAPNERSGIISSSLTNIKVLTTPTIAKNIQNSDFRIDDLMNFEVPISLYFVTPPSDLRIVAVLMKILLTQIIYILTKKMKIVDGRTDYKNKLLLLIDEFPTLGRMNLLHDSLAYVAGYGIKPTIIIQDIAQINKIYGENNSIISNCRISVFYTPNDEKTPMLIEKKLGKKTVKQTTESYDGAFKIMAKKHYNESYISRSLMTPDEISQMDEDKTLIFVTGKKPIMGQKIRWYLEEKFKKRQAIKL